MSVRRGISGLLDPFPVPLAIWSVMRGELNEWMDDTQEASLFKCVTFMFKTWRQEIKCADNKSKPHLHTSHTPVWDCMSVQWGLLQRLKCKHQSAKFSPTSCTWLLFIGAEWREERHKDEMEDVGSCMCDWWGQFHPGTRSSQAVISSQAYRSHSRGVDNQHVPDTIKLIISRGKPLLTDFNKKPCVWINEVL